MRVGPQMEISNFKGMIDKGTVQLRIIKENKFREQNITFRSYIDKNGITWGVPIKVLPNGEIEWMRINLRGDLIHYNLSNPREAKEFHVVKNSPFVEGSPTAGIDVRYRVYDQDIEAGKEVDLFEDLIKAGQFIKDMNYNQTVAYGRLFGISPDTNSPVVIKKMLLEKAKLDPKSILNKMHKESETEIFIVLTRAIGTGYIKTIPDRGLVYKEQIGLGLTEHSAIEFLRNNPTVLMDMDKVSKEKDPHYNATEKSSSHQSKEDADKQF